MTKSLPTSPAHLNFLGISFESFPAHCHFCLDFCAPPLSILLQICSKTRLCLEGFLLSVLLLGGCFPETRVPPAAGEGLPGPCIPPAWFSPAQLAHLSSASSAQLSSAQLSSIQLSSAQLSSNRLSSAQLNSAQLNSAQLSLA